MMSTAAGRRRALGRFVHHPERLSPAEAREHGSCLRHRSRLSAGERADAGRPGRRPLDDVKVPVTLAWAEFDHVVRTRPLKDGDPAEAGAAGRAAATAATSPHGTTRTWWPESSSRASRPDCRVPDGRERARFATATASSPGSIWRPPTSMRRPKFYGDLLGWEFEPAPGRPEETGGYGFFTYNGKQVAGGGSVQGRGSAAGLVELHQGRATPTPPRRRSGTRAARC